MRLAWQGFLLVGAAVATCSAATWQTEDGLSVLLSATDGGVQGVAVDGRDLTVTGTGGLAYQEFTRDTLAPEETVLHIDAEAEDGSWAAASFADWHATGDFARRKAGDAPEGEACLELGDGKSPGVGMAATQQIPIAAGSECTISWLGRTADVALTYILCVRVFDVRDQDITQRAPAPQGWTYSPYSAAHYRSDCSHAQPGTWERLSAPYIVPEGAASIGLSLRVYRDGNLRADVDDIRVTARPGGVWTAPVAVRGGLSQTPQGLVQETVLENAGLRFTTTYAAIGDRLQATCEVSCTEARGTGRCLRLLWRLPLSLAGWRWASEPRGEQSIEAGQTYEDSVGLAGHPLSRYPLVSIADDRTGLAIAADPDLPALQTFRTDAEGIVSAAELAVVPAAPRALVTFCLYRHAPQWGFRAALERYYALFPTAFQGLARRGGAWTLRLPPADVQRPEDFGLAFYECGTIPQAARDYCRTHGLRTLVYIEPWGRRQSFPDAKSRADMPPYEQRLAQLEQWAAEEGGEARWGLSPRREMARAVLSSLLIDKDGIGAHLVDLYSTWAQWWQLNTDPDLPEPSIASLTLRDDVEPALRWADGIYLDSVSMTHAAFEDYAPAHIEAADLPLSFSLQTARPVVLSGMAQFEFMHRLRQRLHADGKLMMLNLFSPATRLFGVFGDVTGCELAGVQDDASALQQRVFAARRPVSNLLQWQWAVLKRVPAMTPRQMEQYLANQLLYGFWPGISTAGGGTEPGYAHMHRYFQDPELRERDRELFRRYIPIFDTLNQAGWEPVTGAKTGDEQVLVERYGSGPEALLAVYNTADTAAEVTLSLDPDRWEPDAEGKIAWRELLTGTPVSAQSRDGALRCRLRVEGRMTAVLKRQEGEQ